MRIRYLFALVLSFSALLAACTAQQPAPAAAPQLNIDAEKAAIAALGDNYVQLFGRKDSAGLAGLYTMDALRITPGQAPSQGNDAIKATIQTGFDNGSQALTIHPDQTVLAEDGRTAVTSGAYEVDVTPPNGKPMKASGLYMNALTKGPDGSWKIARSLVAPVPAPVPTAK